MDGADATTGNWPAEPTHGNVGLLDIALAKHKVNIDPRLVAIATAVTPPLRCAFVEQRTVRIDGWSPTDPEKTISCNIETVRTTHVMNAAGVVTASKSPPTLKPLRTDVVKHLVAEHHRLAPALVSLVTCGTVISMHHE